MTNQAHDPAPLIEIDKVSKLYKMGGETVYALNEVSLTINDGDYISIMGPSGSGKSTLMNVLGCLDLPTSGSYKLDGEEVSRLSDNRLADIRNQKIGFIFQGYNLLPKLSAFENIELPLIYRGIHAKKRRAMCMDALDKVGLSDRADHKPSELSGGQQQRVAIARALAGNPPMLLADEPTGALDTRTGGEVMSFIKELHAIGHTIILITHDSDIAEQARRVVRITDGTLYEQADGGGRD